MSAAQLGGVGGLGVHRGYDSLVAQIAGNIASGMATRITIETGTERKIANASVALAREIVAETKRTEPAIGSYPSAACDDPNHSGYPPHSCRKV